VTDPASASPGEQPLGTDGALSSAEEPAGADDALSAVEAAPAKRTLLGLASLSGTVWVAGGSAVLGASGYAFLTLTARAVPAGQYAALASLYLLVALVGPALFVPVEQETTRLVSRWQALGDGTRDVVHQVSRASAILAGAAVVLLLAAGPVLVSRVFHGSWGLFWALIVSVAGYGGVCLVRGTLAGQRRLRGYGVLVGVDGLVRLVGCLALIAAGVATALPYGLALGLGSAAAFGVGLLWWRPGVAGPRVPWSELWGALGWLLTAWGASSALANLAPVIVTALLPRDNPEAGLFAFAFVVARVPVFVLLSLQAILLPALSRSAATRDLPGLKRGIRQAMIVVGVLGAVALFATAPLCRWLIRMVFGRPPTVSVLALTLLAIGTILAMVIQVLQPALIAVAGHRLVATAWLAGAAVFGACFALPIGPVAAATLAQVLAGAATTAVMAVALLRRLRTSPGLAA
jgi:O-antigen/teichoic acid export membrane protein